LFSPIHTLEATLAITILSILLAVSRYALSRWVTQQLPTLPPIAFGKGGSRPLTGGEQLDAHTSNLLAIQAMLRDDPTLETTLYAVLLRRRRVTASAQLTGSVAMNALSIIAGWLLSALVNPHSVIPFLPR